MPYLGNLPAERYSSADYQDLTGGTGTSFTLDHPVGNAQEVLVVVNNVVQEPGVAYTVSGTGLTMTGSIASTDDCYVVFRGKAVLTATFPSDRALTATDGTFTGDASVTGDLTVDTNTLHVDAANNRVGVGSVSPDTNLDIERSSNDSGGIKVQNTNNSQASAVAQIEISGGDNAYSNLLMECNSTDHSIRQDGSGNLKFINGSTERLRILSGGGLTFNGDTAAANALDDYEEGTWTPSYGGGLSASSYNQQDGRYTKIGNLVHVQFTIDASASTTNASDVQITGFPFSTHAGQPRAGMSFGVNNNWAPDDTMALMNQNNTNMVFLQHNGSALLGTELTTPNAMITITGTYIAA